MKRNSYLTAPNKSKASGHLPKVYLAGKIRKHCWRHKLIYGLRGHSWSNGPLEQSLFSYVGPFFVGCDHGCFHNENSHGSIARRTDYLCVGRGLHAEFDAPHHEVVALCLEAVRKADLVFCYIDSADCHGTLIELGCAIAYGIPFVIAFAPGIANAENNDFWFGCAKARQVIYRVTEQNLKEHLEKSIRRYTWK